MNTKTKLTQSAWRTFLSGLATVLPVAVTAYLVGWLIRASESLFGGMARFVLPEGWYLPGLGLLMAVAVVFLVGAFLNAWLFRQLVELGERILERIPLIKTIYGGLRDLSRFFSGNKTGSELKTVVAVEVQSGVRLIGFVTDNEAGKALPELAPEDDRLVAVYLPMGYQIGGYTLYLPAKRLQSLNLSVEEAMRMVLTAGVDRPAHTHSDSGPRQE
jgi:uncharacterized membrane protein